MVKQKKRGELTKTNGPISIIIPKLWCEASSCISPYKATNFAGKLLTWFCANIQLFGGFWKSEWLFVLWKVTRIVTVAVEVISKNSPKHELVDMGKIHFFSGFSELFKNILLDHSPQTFKGFCWEEKVSFQGTCANLCVKIINSRHLKETLLEDFESLETVDRVEALMEHLNSMKV